VGQQAPPTHAATRLIGRSASCAGPSY
jgi:hypothetical protein